MIVVAVKMKLFERIILGSKCLTKIDFNGHNDSVCSLGGFVQDSEEARTVTRHGFFVGPGFLASV